MFKIEYRNHIHQVWQTWMTVARLVDVINEKGRLVRQGFEVRVLNSAGEPIKGA